MKKPDIPENESYRLEELHSYDIIGIEEQEDFDFLTRMAAEICDTKISLVSLVAEDKQWFLSHHGLNARETSRDYSFCAHAINDPENVFIVEDSRQDSRFHDNPLVEGEPNVIFYAGVPLVNENSATLGSLCVIDDTPHTLERDQIEALQMLAKQAIKLMELRRKTKRIEETNSELKKKEALLKETQSINKIGAWELDLETGETFWTEEVYNIHEVDTSFDHKKSNAIEFYHPDDRPVITEALQKTFDTGEPFDVTVKFITAKNNLRWVRSTGRLWNNDESHQTLIGSFQDITDLKESEQKFLSVYNSSFSFIGILSPDGILLDANEIAMTLGGVERGDVIGKHFWECYWWQKSEQTQKDLKENIKKVAAGEEITYEVEIWIKNKKSVTILFSMRPVFDARGDVKFIIPEGRPIQDIVDARNRYKAVIESIQAGTFEWDLESNEVLINDRYTDMLGYTAGELRPFTIDKWLESVHPDDTKVARDHLIQCLKKEQEYFQLEMRLKHKLGHWVWVLVMGKVIDWSSSGRALKMYGTHQVITERKKIEEELRISEEAFRGNFENAAIGMALLNQEGKWLKVNKRVCEIVGYSEEEMMKLTFQDITHPDDLESDLSLLHELIDGQRNHYQMEKRYFHKDGHTVYIILAVSMVNDDEGNILYFISQIIDITDLKLAEQKLSSALAKNQAILDASTQVAIISTDLEGIITEFNQGAELTLGYSSDELIGKHTPGAFHLEEEIIEEGRALSEEFNKEISGFDVFVYKAKNDIPNTREWTYKRKDGTTFTVLLSITAVKQENEITGFLGVAADISQLKKAEEEIKTLLDITQDQNDRLKNFAHIVTHNLRSHLAGILGMLELIQDETPEIYAHEFVQLLDEGTQNLKKTIEHLTDIVKQNFTEKDDYKLISLHSAVKSNQSSLISTANKENVEIINDVDKNLKISVIPAYLDSIIMNFLTNAIKYSDSKKDSFIRVYSDVESDFDVVCFEDNGIGIDMEKYGQKLFGMYRTFHKHEDSRGLGLFITRNQVESMGGRIDVESEVGVGTTFKIFLPVVDQMQEQN